MKKLIIFNILLVLTLGCVTICAEDNKQIEELTPKFEYETGKVLIDGLYASYSSLDRGLEVNIIEEDDEYYYIDLNGLVVVVEKEFVRLDSEQQFEEYSAYTKNGTKLYKDYELSEVIGSFSLNDEIKVIDAFNGRLLIEDSEGNVGYMYQGTVSKEKIVIVTPKPSYNSGSSSSGGSEGSGGGSTPSYSGGGSSGSSSGGGDSGGGSAPAPSPSQTSGDGEDITLAFYGEEYITVLLNDSLNEKGKILVDNTTTYLIVLNRNDDIKVLERNEDSAVLLISGRKAKVQSKYIRLDSDPTYESFSAFSKNATIYSNFSLSTSLARLSLNEDIKVVDEIDGIYVVELSNGSIGYMRKTDVSKEKIVIVTPKPSYNSGNSSSGESGGSSGGSTPSYSGSGSSGGSSGGGESGGGSAPAPEPTPEWTEPVL